MPIAGITIDGVLVDGVIVEAENARMRSSSGTRAAGAATSTSCACRP
jgi:hypothetical protein